VVQNVEGTSLQQLKREYDDRDIMTDAWSSTATHMVLCNM